MADDKDTQPTDPNPQAPSDEMEYDDYEDYEDLEPVEATGQTVEEAIEHALDELGLERDEVEIEVLSPGRPGREEAHVRVTPLPYEDEELGEEYDEEPYAKYEQQAVQEEQAPSRVLDPEAEPFAAVAKEVLAELIELMDLPAAVSVQSAEFDGDLPSIGLDVSGEYMGILIGRHGDTLAALQFLLGLLASRKAGRRMRVVVDVEGYRERRARLLRDIAARAADRAARYRQPIFLDPMIPSERRIVHLALQDHPYVATHSIGEGDSRRVVVSPKHR